MPLPHRLVRLRRLSLPVSEQIARLPESSTHPFVKNTSLCNYYQIYNMYKHDALSFTHAPPPARRCRIKSPWYVNYFLL
jgi:hypothetical protein